MSNGEYLDENLFVEALAMCALSSKTFGKDHNEIDRIIHLMEKVCQSPGVAKVKKLIGNTRFF